MNFIKSYSILFLFFSISIKNSKAQDPIFSQNLYTRTYLNPAIAGTDSTLVVSGGLQNQPSYNDVKYITYHFSADQYVRFLRGGLGFDAIHDVAGPASLTTTGYNLNYAPHFELFKKKLAVQLGFRVGYSQKSIDWSNVTFDTIDARTGLVSPYSLPSSAKDKINYFDASSGIFMYTKNIYGGVALFHINQPNEGLLTNIALPMKLTINAGANLSFKKDTKRDFIFSPNIIYIKQQDISQLLVGITAKYKWFLLGVSYRNDQTFIYNAGLQFRYFKLGFSLGRSLSLLTNAINSSYEFQLIGFIPYRRKPCPIKTIRFI